MLRARPRRLLERVVTQNELVDRIHAHVAFRPFDARRQELTKVGLVVDAMPDELHPGAEITLGDEAGELVALARDGARCRLALGLEDRISVKEKDLPTVVRLGHGADICRFVVYDGHESKALCSQPLQPLDLGLEHVVPSPRIQPQQLALERYAVGPSNFVEGPQGKLTKLLGSAGVERDAGRRLEL